MKLSYLFSRWCNAMIYPAEYGDMTATTVAEAVKHFLTTEPDPTVRSCPELMLNGVPDEQLARLLEAKGGEIRITIRSIPKVMAAALAEEQTALSSRYCGNKTPWATETVPQ